MRFDVFTLFPEVLEPYLQASILQRAQQRGLVEIHLHNIRDWTTDRHHITDDEPYGGGGGMVMKPEPIFTAVESVLGSPPCCPVILLTPQGRTFTQDVAKELAAPAVESSRLAALAEGEAALKALQDAEREARETDETGEIRASEGLESLSPQDSQSTASNPQSETNNLQTDHHRIALICGRYEGVDERVRQHLATGELSIGDYVITGGELAALIVIDAVSRLIPGVLGAPEGALDDSHASGLLEYPHYTRPPEYRGWRVPDVLLSGDHGRIDRWRREQALLRTLQRRPDLLETAPLTPADRKFLASLATEKESEDLENRE